MSQFTILLIQAESGDPSAAEQSLPLVYDELCKLAAMKLSQENTGMTLQATELVHEAYVRRIAPAGELHWNSRGHFFAAAAPAMRRILVDRARRRSRIKHGGDWNRIELPDLPVDDRSDRELIGLDTALPQWKQEDPVGAPIVKLKYFVGIGREEIAAMLNLSADQVRRKWDYTRAWSGLALEK